MIWTTQQRSKAGSLAVIARGDGPLVVLIHGVGLRAEAWAGQIEALAAHYKVLAVDMPGHGESAAFVAAPNLADYTDAIAALIDQPAVVIGHSFGAMIGFDMAARYSHKVAGLAALNAIYRRSDAAMAAVRARADSLDGVEMVDPEGTLARWFGKTASDQRTACHAWLTAVDPAGYRDAYRVFAHRNGPDDHALQGLQCPALFVTGDREPNSTPQMSELMAARTPNGRSHIVADAAHMLPMTHGSAVNEILLSFLKETST